MEALVHNHQKMETVQLCICREHIVMGHSWAARGKTCWCMSEIADLTHLLCGELWVCCSSHPPFSEFKFNLVYTLSSRSARVTPWDLDSKKKTSENKQQLQKPLMSKRSLIQESVYSVLMIRQCLRMPTPQLWRKTAETSRLLEKVAKQESGTECLKDGNCRCDWPPGWTDSRETWAAMSQDFLAHTWVNWHPLWGPQSDTLLCAEISHKLFGIMRGLLFYKFCFFLLWWCLCLSENFWEFSLLLIT